MRVRVRERNAFDARLTAFECISKHRRASQPERRITNLEPAPVQRAELRSAKCPGTGDSSFTLVLSLTASCSLALTKEGTQLLDGRRGQPHPELLFAGPSEGDFGLLEMRWHK